MLCLLLFVIKSWWVNTHHQTSLNKGWSCLEMFIFVYCVVSTRWFSNILTNQKLSFHYVTDSGALPIFAHICFISVDNSVSVLVVLTTRQIWSNNTTTTLFGRVYQQTLSYLVLKDINPFPNNKFWTLPIWQTLLVTSNYSFSHSVFKRLVLQKRKNQGLFGNGLKDMKGSIHLDQYNVIVNIMFCLYFSLLCFFL